MRKPALVLALFTLFALPVANGQTPCTDPDTQLTCTVGQSWEIYRDSALKAAGTTFTKEVVKKTDDTVANSNRATTPPDAFAGNLHNSYQDFLNLFAFAINNVEESTDGHALTVRFNPLRDGSQVLGFTLTASKPAVSDVVKNAIPEASRTATLEKVNEQISDLDDLTLAASYALQTEVCGMNLPASKRCYGRSTSTYRDLLSHAVAGLFARSPEKDAATIFYLKRSLVANNVVIDGEAAPPLIDNPQGDVFDLPLSAAKDPAALRARLHRAADLEAKQTIAEKQFFSKQNLGVIASMIDNQPQVAFTGSYHDPGKFGGAHQTALSAELQVGPDNINALRAECSTPISDPCLQAGLARRLKDGLSTDKWVLTGTYTRNQDYHLVDLGLDSPVTGFMAVSQKSASELTIKGQGGRTLSAAVGAQSMRADFSIEGHRVEKDRVRTTNRWVAIATITLPYGDKMSIPVSLTYANKPEFLGDQKKQITAHLGLSYRLPMRPSNPSGD